MLKERSFYGLANAIGRPHSLYLLVLTYAKAQAELTICETPVSDTCSSVMEVMCFHITFL